VEMYYNFDFGVNIGEIPRLPRMEFGLFAHEKTKLQLRIELIVPRHRERVANVGYCILLGLARDFWYASGLSSFNLVSENPSSLFPSPQLVTGLLNRSSFLPRIVHFSANTEVEKSRGREGTGRVRPSIRRCLI
jgi:hypothetical protein